MRLDGCSVTLEPLDFRIIIMVSCGFSVTLEPCEVEPLRAKLISQIEDNIVPSQLRTIDGE